MTYSVLCLLQWFIVVTGYCYWLVVGLTLSNSSFSILPCDCPAAHSKVSLMLEAHQFTTDSSLLSRGASKLCDQDLLETMASCLYEEVDILLWAQILSKIQLEKLLTELVEWYRNRNRCPKLFVIHVQHGLGNRLRAIASGLAYVQLMPYIPILIWERDHHLGASWEDLFEDLPNVVVIGNISKSWKSIWKNAAENFYMIDYMNVATKQRYSLPLDYPIAQNIYWKSAYMLQVVGSQPQIVGHFHRLVNSQLSRLTPIQSLRMKISKTCPRKPFVGFHIRRRMLREEKFIAEDPVLEYGHVSARVIDKHRSNNRVAYFCQAAATLLSIYPSATVYLAADSQLSYERWLHCVDNKVAVDRQRIFPDTFPNCENRNRTCIQLALVDLYCLSSSDVLFGSFWSSFTEVAHRLSKDDQDLFYLSFKNNTFRNEAELPSNIRAKMACVLARNGTQRSNVI